MQTFLRYYDNYIKMLFIILALFRIIKIIELVIKIHLDYLYLY